MFLVNSQTVK